MKFTWTPNHSVGVKKFDDEHQQYFLLANKIYDLLDQKDVPRELILANFMSLAQYAFYHLSSEEATLYQYSFPGTHAHILAHDVLRNKIQEYIEKCQAPDCDMPVLVREVIDFASNWLSVHINSTDRLYTEFFANKEI